MKAKASYDPGNIYTKKGRKKMLENDEISIMEAAFMEGYSDAM